MLLSPVRDLRKYPKVMKFLEKNKVYITLTTSPIRLSKLTAALATIDFTYLEKIFIVLPSNMGEIKQNTVIKILKIFPNFLKYR